MGELKRAWNLYRTPAPQRSKSEIAAVHGLARMGVRITCVGVWDTVGALGIPVGIFDGFNRKRYEFHDTRLGENIGCALHAVAIDEKRGPFAPTLWQKPDHTVPQVVEQVWFAGVHSNIGGSYPDTGLSDLTLDWMIKRVRKHTGLAFDDNYVANNFSGDHMGTHNEPRTALYTTSRLLPKQRILGGYDEWLGALDRRANRPEPGREFINEMIHQSALQRWDQHAPFKDGGASRNVHYRPENLGAARGKLPEVGPDGEKAVPMTAAASG